MIRRGQRGSFRSGVFVRKSTGTLTSDPNQETSVHCSSIMPHDGIYHQSVSESDESAIKGGKWRGLLK